ncbi:aminodeoxychorismate synthase component I [uncultured Shimia sp.]|uniref:aminodeoxychorismate synthase component I n=1 Tax=uncultured Shimia sp. TaxID=573152 RepID=UPI00262CC2B0|nr:aminodeoxychorismate synthase component I [uncultured Shimia sp.]
MFFHAAKRFIVAETQADVPAALERLDQTRQDGFWLAGYASYEMGYALEPRLSKRMPAHRRVPLICFGAFDAPEIIPQFHELPFDLGSFAANWSSLAYEQAFQKVRDLIGQGDIYQANLTFPMRAAFRGDPLSLYNALARRQPVGHGAYIQQPGLPTFLSRSPELFFRTDTSGRIETRPMKGTQPRSIDPQEDARRKLWLVQDEKNRAENLMIVDLLRNDISRVAMAGSVHVPDLFRIETYATVHQMVSTVAAQLKQDATLSDIFRALFPCGSITGAPKLRAMEILNDLEPWPRDIYCGTIGWAAPDGRSEFNVAIRTLMIEDDTATLNVGGGVVWDSTATSEFEEALWKARFARQFLPEPA